MPVKDTRKPTHKKRPGQDRNTWATPDGLFNYLSDCYGPFDVDVCAVPGNARCAFFFEPGEDGLAQSWRGKRCWCNPPYSDIYPWVAKAVQESKERGATVVMLLPARTGSQWFHDFSGLASEILFLRGRVRFKHAPSTAPFDSLVLVFRPYQPVSGRATRLMFVENELFRY